jgi:proteasome lid subunit RPN8/RPN11
MMTEGQEWALSQLEEISAASRHQFEVIAVREPAESAKALAVEISVDCRGYRKEAGGLPLRPRERFVVSIPGEFPLDRPDVTSTHTRFAGFPHVQWGRQICLYQAPDTEWRPDDGMFGYIQRFDEWLAHAARGEFDPVGFPLHPPVAYQSSARAPMVVPRVNAPAPASPWWVGYAQITAETDVRIELGKWLHYQEEIPRTRLAVAILLPTDMPFEYPTTIKELERVLAARNVSADLLQVLLEMAALRNKEGKPLYFVLGSAMRGMSGAAERLQHLACWFVSAEQSALLYTAALRAEESEGKIAATEFATWAETAAISWCEVREERPEIVVSRDQGSPLSWWRGRRVTILGCGAIGSVVAMLITRAGVAKIRLYDHRLVAPGALVRQNYDRRLIGYTKVSATRVTVQAINPDLEVDALHENAVMALRTKAEVLLDAYIVINSTASTRVAAALEKKFRNKETPHPPIASMVFGHRADMGLMTYAVPNGTGITLDLDRRAKIAFANALNGQQMLEEFWPSSPSSDRLFQPEPGCSDPTFIGSAADVFGLTSAMLNMLSRWLTDADDTRSRVYALRSLSRLDKSTLPAEFHLAWTRDRILNDAQQGYQIRISNAAENALMGWIHTSRRRLGECVETGGLLFGQIDEFLKVVWIDEVSGPPPDSLASAAGFVCGVEGTAALNREKIARTRGSIRFVGMWHTHPDGAPRPSCTDLRAMNKLWKLPDFSARHFLMLIIGGGEGWYHVSGNLFARRRRRS